MLSVIAGGRDVSRSAERAPFGLEFDRLAVGEITVANSDHRGGNGPAVPVEAATEKQAACLPRPILSDSQVLSPRPADKPEADTLLPSVSGAYSPWTVRPSNNSLRSIYP